MRRDIFLHFLNRDSREIYGLFKTKSDHSHAVALSKALNAAVILCEDRCIMPPGFVVECDIAFGVMENLSAYLKDRLVVLPMRESNLSDFAEKKRQEYSGMRNKYAGLFNDARIEFLASNAEGLVPRRCKIGEQISRKWIAGPDTARKLWRPTVKLLPGTMIEAVRRIPQRLMDAEIASTWEAIRAAVPPEAHAANLSLRRILQNIYFRQYMSEFSATILSNAPLMTDDFELATIPRGYDYFYLSAFLNQFGLTQSFLNARAEEIIAFKRQPGFIRAIDAFVDLAKLSSSITGLSFAAGTAAKKSKFDWKGFNARHMTNAKWTELEIVELADGLGEVADILALDADLPRRSNPTPALEKGKPKGGSIAIKIQTDEALMKILFLAANPSQTTHLDLEEELRSLEQELKSVKFRNAITLTARHAVRPDDLVRYVRAEKPNIIHFSGHGSKGGIFLRADSGGYQQVEGTNLRRFLEGRGIDLVVLNSCYSRSQVDTIGNAVKAVIGTTDAVDDEAARRFSVAFYRSLGEGLSVDEAFRDGVDSGLLHGFPDIFCKSGSTDLVFVS